MSGPQPKLHQWFIDPRERARQIVRRGREHAYPVIDPRRTALVIIDMIPFFVEANPYCLGIVPNVVRLVNGLHAAGGSIAWVVPARGHRYPDRAVEFFGTDVAELFGATVGDVPLRDRIWHEFDVGTEHIVCEKTQFSAFFPGACGLSAMLDRRGVDTVVICGTVTNVCCESSARDAHSSGLRVLMAADANAARRDAEHNATLQTIYRSFGDVRSTDELLTMFQPNRR